MLELFSDKEVNTIFRQLLNARKITRVQMEQGSSAPEAINGALQQLTSRALIEMIPGPIQQLDTFVPTKEGLEAAERYL